MEKKRYKSYKEIDRELEILKVQKEINLQKIVLNVKRTKESIMPFNLVKGLMGSYSSIFPITYGKILTLALPVIINWLRNRKRGN